MLQMLKKLKTLQTDRVLVDVYFPVNDSLNKNNYDHCTRNFLYIYVT